MENSTFVVYELIEPITGEWRLTHDRYEANDRFREGWMVCEKQISTVNPALHIQTQQIVVATWNNSPDVRKKKDATPEEKELSERRKSIIASMSREEQMERLNQASERAVRHLGDEYVRIQTHFYKQSVQYDEYLKRKQENNRSEPQS